MIYFFADDHYKVHPGRVIWENLKHDYQIEFHENDWSVLERPGSLADCSLLILHMIADTCGNALPGAEAEKNIRAYCERGGNLLLLHGSSAAFWHWPWWRSIVGLRWVRGNDPDAVPVSTHPKRPYLVRVAKTRHPLAGKLRPLDLPEDEIYINLEQVNPVWILMNTDTEEGTFPQCYENATPWGGRVIGFIPGHRPEVTGSPELIANLKVLIDTLNN